MERRLSRRRRGGGSATAEYGKTASFLAIGVGLTGVITYAYFLIASHVLSKPDYGQITVLWSAVFITISTLYRPVEQLLSRHISERLVEARTDRPADAGRLDDPARPRRSSSPSSPWPCAGRSRTTCWKATKRSTGSSSARSSSTPPATSPAASSPASARFGLFTALILSESCLPHPLRGAGRGRPAQRPVRGRGRDRRRARRSA